MAIEKSKHSPKLSLNVQHDYITLRTPNGNFTAGYSRFKASGGITNESFTKLMKFVEEQACIFGCEFIKLTSRKDEGKALYRSLGYMEGSSFRKDLSVEVVFGKFTQEDYCKTAGL